MNRPLTSCMTYSKNGFVTDGYENNETIKGRAFFVETVFTVAIGNTLDIVIDPRLVSNSMILLPSQWSVNQGYVEISVGVCTGYSGGTKIENLNRDFNKITTNKEKTLISYGATVEGFTGGLATIPVGTTSTNQNSGGGGYESRGIIIPDISKIYVYRIPNTTGEELKLGLFARFFENGVTE